MQFSGDNGGATHHGVNAKEIHVAVRVLNEKGFQQTLAALAGASLSDTPDDIKRTMVALAEYFNYSYQFYGRKIVLDFYDGQGSNTTELLGGGRDKAQVDATTVQSMKSFADLSATSEPYADALARKDIVGFGDPTCRPSGTTNTRRTSGRSPPRVRRSPTRPPSTRPRSCAGRTRPSSPAVP